MTQSGPRPLLAQRSGVSSSSRLHRRPFAFVLPDERAPRQKKFKAPPIKRVRVLHLRPMATVLHLKQGDVGDQFSDCYSSIEKYIAVVDGCNHERGCSQRFPVLVWNSISVVDLGVEQSEN